MYDRGIIKETKWKNGKIQYDRYYTSNVHSNFSYTINAKDVKGSILRGKGKLRGTTYSGHPTCTTLCGTLRNLLYHMFAVWRDRV